MQAATHSDKRTHRKNKKSETPKAKLADKYDLYQQSVQAPDFDCDFMSKAYRRDFNRSPRILREDFCGTHLLCCKWVKGKKDRQAIGVDIDPEPLKWGVEHNQSLLKEDAQKRIRLLEDDVRNIEGQKSDILAAHNFSYWIFKTRDTLREYFKCAHDNLDNQGVMILDMMGGPEAMTDDMEDVQGMNGFEYVWDQDSLDPISHDCTFHIHFRFRDGSEMKNAFTYNWRFWTIPEVRELLTEAGFDRVDVYWEGTDPETGEGNDEYFRVKTADCDPAWIAYIVAVKNKK